MDLLVSYGVKFVGPTFDQDKDLLFREADAFILPSFSEGLPITILEAWSYQFPVIMTSACNLGQGFDVGAAIKVAPTISSIADGLHELITLTDEDRVKAGNAGRLLVEEEFSWEKVAADTLAVYQWILTDGDVPACVRAS
jgi:glycosyltransferase involved in cell wall biosynthesis